MPYYVSIQEETINFVYSLCGHILKNVDSYANTWELTLVIKWDTHISEMTSKAIASWTIGFPGRNLQMCPSCKLKELAYFSLVCSNLKYSATLWNPHCTKDIKALNKIQRKAARFVVVDCSWESSVSKILKELEWKDLTDMRRVARLVM